MQVFGGLIGAAVGAYNASQQCGANLNSILAGAGIGLVVGVASTFGVGPLATAFFAGGSAAAGNIAQQAISNGGFDNINFTDAAVSGVTGAALGGTTSFVGRYLAPNRLTNSGISPSSALPRRSGQTQRMLPRPPQFAPDSRIANGIDLSLNGTASGGIAHASTRGNIGGSKCGCR